MLDVPTQIVLAKRLERIEGRVSRIRLQVQDGKVCPDLLQDLASAQGALSEVRKAIIRFHVASCVQRTSEERDTVAQMAELIDIFDRFL